MQTTSFDKSPPANQGRRQFPARWSPPMAIYCHPILVVISLFLVAAIMVTTPTTTPVVISTVVQVIHHDGVRGQGAPIVNTSATSEVHTRNRGDVTTSNATHGASAIGDALHATGLNDAHASCTTNIALVSVVPSFRKGTYSRIVADLHLAQMEQLMASDRCLHRHEVVQCSPKEANEADLSSSVAKLLQDSDGVVVVDSSVLFSDSTAVFTLVQLVNPKDTTLSSVKVFQQDHVSGVAVVSRLFKKEVDTSAMSQEHTGCNKTNPIPDLLQKGSTPHQLPESVARIFADANCTSPQMDDANLPLYCSAAAALVHNWYLKVMPPVYNGTQFLDIADNSSGMAALVALGNLVSHRLG